MRSQPLPAAPQQSEVAGVIAAPAGPLVVPALEALELAAPAPPHLSLVIPTLNERENIADFLAAVRLTLNQAIPGSYEVIVVDDDSADRTWEIAAGLVSGLP